MTGARGNPRVTHPVTKEFPEGVRMAQYTSVNGMNMCPRRAQNRRGGRYFAVFCPEVSRSCRLISLPVVQALIGELGPPRRLRQKSDESASYLGLGTPSHQGGGQRDHLLKILWERAH